MAGSAFAKPRYWTEWDAQGERLVMPLRRSWKVVGGALLAFGFGAIQALVTFSDEPDFFDYVVAAVLLFGFVHLLLNVLTSVLAREVLRIETGTLVHGLWLLGFKHEKRYPLREVFGLSADRRIEEAKDDQLISPLRDFGKKGAVAFEFKDRTVVIGASLDEAHGRQVVDWIGRRAPRSVFDLT